MSYRSHHWNFKLFGVYQEQCVLLETAADEKEVSGELLAVSGRIQLKDRFEHER